MTMKSISLLCPVHHKEREQLNYVCLHRGCGAKLLCHECLAAHRDHHAPNLHRFVDLAEEMLYDRTLTDRKKAIKHGKVQFRAKTGQLREEIGRQLAEAEAAADRFFDEADARLTALQTKEEAVQLRLFAFEPKPVEKLADEVCQLRGDFLAKQQIRVEFANAITTIEADVAQRTNSVAEIMTKQLLPQVSRQIGAIVARFAQAKITTWNPSLKHSDIAINGGSISRITMTSNKDSRGDCWPVCCLGGEMGDSDGGLRRWSVRFAKMQSGMGIGMCQIRQAQSHKLEGWNLSNIEHGHYCVDSNGYVFSHSDASANKYLSFTFGTGDVLRFEYDPKQGKLTVQNQKGGRYEWSVQRKGEKYAVCAYLWDIGDAAELMDS